MTCPITRRYAVHVHGPTLEANRATGGNAPVVVWRDREDPDTLNFCRKVEILGPSVLTGPATCVPPEGVPLTGTNGRAVCWVETDGPLRVYTDDGGRSYLGFEPEEQREEDDRCPF